MIKTIRNLIIKFLISIFISLIELLEKNQTYIYKYVKDIQGDKSKALKTIEILDLKYQEEKKRRLKSNE